MGGRWVPGVSMIGLAGLIALPTPGVAGVMIGGGCLALIAAWAAMVATGFVLAGLAAPVLRRIRPAWTTRRRRRDLHAGSGIARRSRAGAVRPTRTAGA